MNLQPLFETQKKLMDRIGYNEPDRFEKTILALLVEVGECANEWRGFKYWSQDREPRVKIKTGYQMEDNEHGGISPDFNKPVYKNPLLEEYVDGLHFVLQLGIECGIDFKINIRPLKKITIVEQFLKIFSLCSTINNVFPCIDILDYYCGLGEMFGFTWEEITAAYMDKNKINHERQENGY
jgi:dimeric dUTPase (all-alpha-NTP-PPase superfamily)